jgi:hypothetical protein
MSQPFKGYRAPTFTQTPNEAFDAMPELTGAEFKCLMYVVRNTFGYHERVKQLSLTQFCTGRTKRDGTVLDRGTGLNRETVVVALRGLVEKGHLIEYVDETDKGRVSKAYGLNMLPEDADEDAGLVGKSDYPQSENPTTPSRKIRPRTKKETIETNQVHIPLGVASGMSDERKPTFDDLFGSHTRPTELPLSVRLHTAIRTAFYQDRKVTQSEEFLIAQAVKDLVSVEFKPEDVQGFYDWLMGKGFTALTPRAMGNHVNTYLGEIQAPKARRTFTIEGE